MMWRGILLGGLALSLALGTGGGTTKAQGIDPDDLPVEAIQGIVRDYLVNNPEVIEEALQALRQQQLLAQRAAQKRLIAQLDAELFANPDDPVIGNPKADVTVVEFFDYRCGYCRRMAPDVKQLLDEDPNLRIVMKELPVLGQDSVIAARASLAAQRQDAYEAFHFALMDSPDLSEHSLRLAAEKVGMNYDQLRIDMADPALDDVIEGNYRLARQLRVEGTPALIIGDQLIPGGINLARMKSLIATARADQEPSIEQLDELTPETPLPDANRSG